MAWLGRSPSKLKDTSEKRDFPEGVWFKCSHCQEIVLKSDFEENIKVCPVCSYHHRLTVDERLNLLIEAESFEEWDSDLYSTDPLAFSDGKPYKDKLAVAYQKTGRCDAILTGGANLMNHAIAIGIMDFSWMGGSMGSVVGERIVRLFLRAKEERRGVILVSASGGARMHEGLVSLMQMARTSMGIALLREAGLPYISVLTDPTTGGVAASFSMLGDIHLAEPGATIGFAGRRVIESTMKQKLPDDFQTAEFCQEHGIVDQVVKRSELKQVIGTILDILCPVRDRTDLA